MTWLDVGEFGQRHKEGLGLLAVAMIVTMRPKLPWPFCRVDALEWFYEWVREGLLTLLSFRGSVAHPPVSQSTERVPVDSGEGKTGA